MKVCFDLIYQFTLLSSKMLIWRRCTIDAATTNIPGVSSMTQMYSIDDDEDKDNGNDNTLFSISSFFKNNFYPKQIITKQISVFCLTIFPLIVLRRRTHMEFRNIKRNMFVLRYVRQ